MSAFACRTGGFLLSSCHASKHRRFSATQGHRHFCQAFHGHCTAAPSPGLAASLGNGSSHPLLLPSPAFLGFINPPEKQAMGFSSWDLLHPSTCHSIPLSSFLLQPSESLILCTLGVCKAPTHKYFVQAFPFSVGYRLSFSLISTFSFPFSLTLLLQLQGCLTLLLFLPTL